MVVLISFPGSPKSISVPPRDSLSFPWRCSFQALEAHLGGWVFQDCVMPPAPDFPFALPAPQGVQLKPVGLLLSWVYNCLSLQPLLMMLSPVPFPWLPGQSMLCFTDSGKFFGQIRCCSLSSLVDSFRIWMKKRLKPRPRCVSWGITEVNIVL